MGSGRIALFSGEGGTRLASRVRAYVSKKTVSRIEQLCQIILRSFVALSVAGLAAGPCRALDAKDIVERATEALKADWAADPLYANMERDETRKGDKSTSKTFVVVMIDGSDYHFPVAFNDEPLTPSRRETELARLREEVRRRRHESPEACQSRVEVWQKERDENGELLLDFPGVLDLALLGEEMKDGHSAYVFAATPKPGIAPATRSEKVLAGVEGKAWVDKETLHPFRIECTVVQSVPVFGPLARVLPGTEIGIGMTRVTDSTWLIDRVSISLNLVKLQLFKSTTKTISTYTRYRPNSIVLSELLEEADQR